MDYVLLARERLTEGEFIVRPQSWFLMTKDGGTVAEFNCDSEAEALRAAETFLRDNPNPVADYEGGPT